MSEIATTQKRRESFNITVILIAVVTVVLALSDLSKKTTENRIINQLKCTNDSLSSALIREKEAVKYWKTEVKLMLEVENVPQ